jgi:hypothetical protein
MGSFAEASLGGKQRFFLDCRVRDLANAGQGFFFIFAVKLSWLHRILQ